ncbi:MAG: TPM domain-containing protein [Thermoanaerobaculia bacterium]
MKRACLTILLIVLSTTLLLPAQLRALDIPDKPTAWVTDTAGVLDAASQQQMNEKLEAFYKRTGSQFLVFIFPSLEGEALEDFTIRVAEKWKVRKDRALILFVFVQDKKIRIEVGYGLEGSVTDAISSRVIRNTIAPEFRNGNYAGGISKGLDQLMAVVEKGETAIPAEPVKGTGRGGLGDILPLLFIALVFLIVIGPMLARGGCAGCGCLPFLPFIGGGTTLGGGWGGGGFGGGSGGGGGGWGVGGGWGGGGGGSFGGGGASGGW